MPITTAPL